MNQFNWGCFFTLILTVSIKLCPLVFVGCDHINTLGYLTVEPPSPFLKGSNLTVFCHLTTCLSRPKLTLELDDVTVSPWIVGCTAAFNLSGVHKPKSSVVCRLKRHGHNEIVGGLDLESGLPPDKPAVITCETTRTSVFLSCSWRGGQETHLPTNYRVVLSRENGTRVYDDRIQAAEEMTIPRAMLADNSTYKLIISADNHLGAAQSDPFTLCVQDLVIPARPHITNIDFVNNSRAAVLQWTTTESSRRLKSSVRLRRDNGFWEMREPTRLSDDVTQVDRLEPLMEYEFQLRLCDSASELHRISTCSFMPELSSGERSRCSKWSPPVKKTSPGIGPSQLQHVWRVLSNPLTDERQTVAVLWKPPPPEERSGEVQQYKLYLNDDPKEAVNCSAAQSQCSLVIPPQVHSLSISVLTLYGTSPPADVPLTRSGTRAPALRQCAPAVNDNAALVSWSTPRGELSHYVIEWTSGRAAGLQWRKLTRDQNTTIITGLMAGVRYNIALYAVTSRGVSAPSSSLCYSREQKPATGPDMSVLVDEAKRILIQWDELSVDQQRGFITNYTIYVQSVDSSNPGFYVTVSASRPRQMRLDCPDGALALWMTASTSAGEGPPGRGISISCQPAAPGVGLVVGAVFSIALFMAVIVNLMCWSCVRKRIKQRFISWGPDWLFQNLPEAENSNAIKLLQDRSEPSFSYIHEDPPLSPISCVSQEEMWLSAQQTTVDAPLSGADPTERFVHSQLKDSSYKPQAATFLSQEDQETETEEGHSNLAARGEEDSCAGGGFLRELLSSVEVQSCDSPLRLTLNSLTSGLLWTETSEMESNGNRNSSMGEGETDSNMEAVSSSVELHQTGTLTPVEADTVMSGGYFPQVMTLR